MMPVIGIGTAIFFVSPLPLLSPLTAYPDLQYDPNSNPSHSNPPDLAGPATHPNPPLPLPIPARRPDPDHPPRIRIGSFTDDPEETGC